MKKEEVLERYDNAVAFFLNDMKGRGLSSGYCNLHMKVARVFRKFWCELHQDEDDVRDLWYLDFQLWRDNLQESGLSRQTISMYLSNMHRIFESVSDEELGDLRFYEKNPASKRLYPDVSKDEKRPYDEILTDEQVLKLWENKPVSGRGLKPVYWPRNYAIVVLLLSTELRNKEVLDLTVNDLDFEYEEIQVRHGKGDKYRCVDFPKIAQTAIKLYLKSGIRPEGLSDDDYLFGTDHPGGQGVFGHTGVWKRGTMTWLSKVVNCHVRNVTGVDMVGTHDLRHVGARLDLHNGMRAEELQAKLGHSNITTTQIYSGKLGANRKRVTARRVYEERDIQAARNEMMLQNAV